MEEEGSSEIFTIPNVWSLTLSRVFDYCREHLEFRTRAAPADGDQSGGDAKAFDDGFAMANRIKNKSAEYVRKLLGIIKDYTTDEENEVREKNAWAFEGVDED
ncbi:hypothetical protein L6164_002461 [Bauhinia variegata]|uniref:Uncharacterized protein n=1 Tax=Bauhinia variegata TaxID=167791 RepID=A0ACB9PXQ8_BAUVA|nr:hypothetical protein L6164_002461 [Bauhinia variegata]